MASPNRRVCSSALAIGDLSRQRGVPLFLEREESVRSTKLALHQGHDLPPRVRHQLDVLQIPVVVLDPDAGRPRLRRELRPEPGGERIGRLLCASDVCRQRSGRVRDARGEPLQIGALAPDTCRAELPEILAIADEILPRLFEKAGNCSDAGSHSVCISGSEREAVAPDLHRAERVVPFAGGLIAPAGKHRDVERGIVRPGPQHAVVEVQPVHLGTDDVPVDLLRDRPAGPIDRGQTSLEGGERFVLRGHCRSGVVRHSVNDARLLEFAPFLEQR